MKIKFFLILMLATSGISAQQLTQTVKGTITDIDTKTPLAGASIVLSGSDPIIATISDGDGQFKLEKVPIGRQSFIISFIGFEQVTLTEILVSTGREVVLNVEMKESLTSIKEVTVVAKRDKIEALNSMATVSVQQITVESTSRIAAGINDPARTALSLAGVSSGDDVDNELVVRGNSPRGMLWRMEGIPIPNPNHFPNGEGSSGGGVSALSTQVLSNSDFFTGAFPAEYGDALSGVFDLRLRNGNAEKREYAIQMGVLGAQLAAEGPLKKGSQATYLVNYRYSTLEMLSKIGIDISGGDIIPEFQDLSYKIYLPTRSIGKISIWGLSGLSSAGSNPLYDSTLWKYRSDQYGETENHKLSINGITHTYPFKNDRTYLRTVAAYSYSSTNEVVDSIGPGYAKSITQDARFKYGTFSVNSFLNHKFNSKHILRAGLMAHHRSFDLYMKDFNYEEKYLETLVSNSGSTGILESYLQWQYRINKRVELNSGFHSSYLLLNNDFTIEPRVAMSWKVNSKNSLNLGAGLHSKPEPVSIYLAEKTSTDGTVTTPNKNLGITKAVHLVAGHNWNFAKDFRLKTELYYQHLYNVPVKEGDTTGTISALNFTSGYTNEKFVNTGTGRNYGLELTLEKFFSNQYYFLATTSLYESLYTIPGFEERNSIFNGKHIYNFIGGKEYSVGKNKQNIIGVNVRLIWRGGFRTIPVDIEESLVKDQEVLDYSRAFETKASDYIRLDFGLSYRKNKPDWSWVISLNLQNATNRLNVGGYYYSTETKQIESWYLAGIIPILNYRIEI